MSKPINKDKFLYTLNSGRRVYIIHDANHWFIFAQDGSFNIPKNSKKLISMNYLLCCKIKENHIIHHFIKSN